MRLGFLLSLIGCLMACAGPAPTAAGPTAPPHIQSAILLYDMTVALVTDRHGSPGAYCSGVWVGPSTILTANHCVDEYKQGDKGQFVVHADVYADWDLKERERIQTRTFVFSARDEAHDLALLYVPFAPLLHGVAKVSNAVVRPGQPVQTMGHPIGLWWSYSSGEVASVRVIETIPDVEPFLTIQVTAPISPGNSGGGLFDEDGMLLGIAHVQVPRGQNLNFYIHSEYCQALIVRVGAP